MQTCYCEEHKKKDKDLYVCKICAYAIDNYPSILNRISNVELYYLCENFLERDKYNNQKRSMQETADKLISFAKGECVNIKDAKNISKINNNILDEEKCNNYGIGKLGKGIERDVYGINKRHFLSSNKNNNIAFAIKHIDNSEANSDDNIICSKILLSLFARQTKYYNSFIMKEIQEPITLDGLTHEMQDNEKNKEIAREMLFSMYDLGNIWDYSNADKAYEQMLTYGKAYDTNGKVIENKYGSIGHNIMLGKDGKMIYIDLGYVRPLSRNDVQGIYDIIKKSKFSFDKIISNLKKNLTIGPKLIAYHTLMELKKYKFKDFDDKEHANSIKYILGTYQSLISATKDNFAKIDKDVVEICEKQLKLYDNYIATINKYSLKDFENDFQQEQEQITSKINKYRSMSGIIKGKTKKPEPIPLQGCNNNVAKNQSLKEQKEING